MLHQQQQVLPRAALVVQTQAEAVVVKVLLSVVAVQAVLGLSSFPILLHIKMQQQQEHTQKPHLVATQSTLSLVLEPSLSNLFKEQSTWHISQK